jgi:hypothetical protein
MAGGERSGGERVLGVAHRRIFSARIPAVKPSVLLPFLCWRWRSPRA